MIKIGNNLRALLNRGLVQQKAAVAGKVQTSAALTKMMQPEQRELRQPPKKKAGK